MVKKANSVGREPNVVERAVAHVGGSQSELARRLSDITGEDIPRQRVFGWLMRGTFPRDMLVHVETLCGIPLEELIAAEPKDRDAGNVVNRAIRFLGEEANAAKLAAELTTLSGKRITRQMVNNWQVAEQFPVDMVPYVHLLCRIPVKELLPSRAARKSKKSDKRSEKRAA